MIRRELTELQTRILQLRDWHQTQRDRLPWFSGDGHAINAALHDNAAQDCQAAALAIEMLLERSAPQPEGVTS